MKEGVTRSQPAPRAPAEGKRQPRRAEPGRTHRQPPAAPGEAGGRPVTTHRDERRGGRGRAGEGRGAERPPRSRLAPREPPAECRARRPAAPPPARRPYHRAAPRGGGGGRGGLSPRRKARRWGGFPRTGGRCPPAVPPEGIRSEGLRRRAGQRRFPLTHTQHPPKPPLRASLTPRSGRVRRGAGGAAGGRCQRGCVNPESRPSPGRAGTETGRALPAGGGGAGGGAAVPPSPSPAGVSVTGRLSPDLALSPRRGRGFGLNRARDALCLSHQGRSKTVLLGIGRFPAKTHVRRCIAPAVGSPR